MWLQKEIQTYFYTASEGLIYFVVYILWYTPVITLQWGNYQDGILFAEEYNKTHSIGTTFLQSCHLSIPLAVAREAEAHWADDAIQQWYSWREAGFWGKYFIAIVTVVR